MERRRNTAAATTNAAAKAHKCSASHTATEPAVLSSHETTAPITPGNAEAAFPASAFNQPARVFSCFLTQSTTLADPGGEGGAGAGDRPPPSAFWIANTIVDTTKPNAVSTDAMVTPSSRNSVRRRSASVVSSSAQPFPASGKTVNDEPRDLPKPPPSVSLARRADAGVSLVYGVSFRGH